MELMGAAAPRPAPPRSRPAAVWGFVVLLAAGCGAATWALHASGADPPGLPAEPALIGLGALLVAAEFLFVRFRYRGEINALNLFEAGLAPLVFAYPAVAAVAVVAGAQVVGNLIRRNALTKSAFNTAQWGLATVAGSAVLHALTSRQGISASTFGALALTLAVISAVNQACFSTVLALSNGESLTAVFRGLRGAMIPGWLIGFLLNAATGLLFVLAFQAHPASVVLFPVPLFVLHIAYRGYAGARSDRLRLAGLHTAAQTISEPLDPEEAIEPFLREVARGFEARGAALVLRSGAGYLAHRRNGEGAYEVLRGEPADGSLEAFLLHVFEPARLVARNAGPAGAALARSGSLDALVAPLREEGGVVGALAVFDQVGLEGFEAGELAVLEALARETAAALGKGRLLRAILDERERFAEIVSATSDGIFSLDSEGRVRSWNPAMEKITGLAAADVAGRPSPLGRIVARTASGEPVDLNDWDRGRALPADFFVTVDGVVKRLFCSYSPVAENRSLIVVARDATTETEITRLRYEFDQLAEAQEQQRHVVEQLQRALVPPRPHVEGLQFGLRYQSSDVAAPTGGDLYDWVVLPGGEIHAVVVDVLGHGVAATNDAVGVVHTLRTLAIEGCPVDEMVARADRILGRLSPDLVATVLVARIDVASRHAVLAGGGHPPALHVSLSGGVRQVAAPGGAIGWPHAGSAGVAHVDLEPGDALLLYTDGLIEGSKDILAGEDALMHHARVLADLPAEEIAAGLVERSIGSGERRDDSLALVIRMPPACERYTQHLDPTPSAAHSGRIEASRWLRSRGIADRLVEDVELVVGELLANAVVAARRAVRLTLDVEPTTVTVEAEDDGPGDPALERTGREMQSADVDAGRGLFIVRTIAAAVTFVTTSSGTLVRAVVERAPVKATTVAEHQPGARPVG